ncbi:hypothetical protein BGZ80_002554, partial [Entomortierella chlamydospora]
ETKSPEGQKFPFSLRRLCLEGNIYDQGKYHLFSLLQNSPQLEELSLPKIDDRCARNVVDTLHQFCPGLRKISIDNEGYPGGSYIGLWGPAAAVLLLPDLLTRVRGGHKPDLLNLRQSNLREIRLSLWQDVDNIFYRAILGSHTIASSSPSRLQVLHIVDAALNSTALPTQILGRCPHMKDLYIDGGQESPWEGGSRVGVDLEALVEQDWVCTGMESLKLDIGIKPQNDDGYSTRLMEFADLLWRLYQKLCSLKSLRKLELVWIGLGKLHSTPVEILLSVMNNNGEDGQKGQRIKITGSDLECMGLGGWPTTSQLNEHHYRNIAYPIALKCHQALEKLDDAHVIGYYFGSFPDNTQNRAKYYKSWDGLKNPWYFCDGDDEWLDEPWYRNCKTYIRTGKCHQRIILTGMTSLEKALASELWWVCSKLEYLKLDIEVKSRHLGDHAESDVKDGNKHVRLLRRLHQKHQSLKSPQELELPWVDAIDELQQEYDEDSHSVMNVIEEKTGPDTEKSQMTVFTRSELEWMGLGCFPSR